MHTFTREHPPFNTLPRNYFGKHKATTDHRIYGVDLSRQGGKNLSLSLLFVIEKVFRLRLTDEIS